METELPWDPSRMEFKPVEMTVKYEGGMRFSASTSTGMIIPIDAHLHLGGGGTAPNPIDYLISSLGGCIGIKILLCLSDENITPASLTIRIQATRRQTLPAVFDHVHLIIDMKGEMNDDHVSEILSRTMTHLCPISAMFGEIGSLTYEYRILHE